MSLLSTGAIVLRPASWKQLQMSVNWMITSPCNSSSEGNLSSFLLCRLPLLRDPTSNLQLKTKICKLNEFQIWFGRRLRKKRESRKKLLWDRKQKTGRSWLHHLHQIMHFCPEPSNFLFLEMSLRWNHESCSPQVALWQLKEETNGQSLLWNRYTAAKMQSCKWPVFWQQS